MTKQEYNRRCDNKDKWMGIFIALALSAIFFYIVLKTYEVMI